MRAPDHERIIRLVEMIGLRPGDRVLYAGCGTGVLLPFLKTAIGPQGEITAIDSSQNMIIRAWNKYGSLENIDFRVCDIMQYQDQFGYDALIVFNFFPYIQDKTAFFRRAWTMVKENGFLVIMQDMSRPQGKGVNHVNRPVAHDLLPPGEAIGQWLGDAAGYKLQLVLDRKDRYFTKAVRTVKRRNIDNENKAEITHSGDIRRIDAG